MAVTELFVERDINLYIYVYISLWHLWVAHSVRCFVTRLVVLTSCCHWGGRTSKKIIFHLVCFFVAA